MVTTGSQAAIQLHPAPTTTGSQAAIQLAEPASRIVSSTRATRRPRRRGATLSVCAPTTRARGRRARSAPSTGSASRWRRHGRLLALPSSSQARRSPRTARSPASPAPRARAGRRGRAPGPQPRRSLGSLALSAVAMLAFLVGTLLGGYGLVLLLSERGASCCRTSTASHARKQGHSAARRVGVWGCVAASVSSWPPRCSWAGSSGHDQPSPAHRCSRPYRERAPSRQLTTPGSRTQQRDSEVVRAGL